ncbi:MAG: flagellar hook assembly protein FlgD [Pseudomonadota bacterium]
MTTINNNVDVYNDLGLTRNNEVKAEPTKQDQFMELMIAQLKNQDPLEPQENGEFLTQLAQMDTATGISDLQTSFDKFASSMQSNSALQASTLVGHHVLIPGGTTYFNGVDGVSGTVSLDSSTSSLKIDVTDSSGQLVKTFSLGEQLAGDVKFGWDGLDEGGDLMPPGQYTFKASSQLAGETVAQNVSLGAKVDSVSVGQYGQSLKLNLLGMGQVNFTDVTEIW